VLISDPINGMPPNADSDAKRVWKYAAILKNLTLDVVSTILNLHGFLCMLV